FLMLLNLQSFTGEPSALKTEINDFLARLTGVSSLLFIVYALNRMRPFFWWLVAFVLLIDFPLNIFFHGQYFFISQIFRAMVTIVFAWLVFVAFTTKK